MILVSPKALNYLILIKDVVVEMMDCLAVFNLMSLRVFLPLKSAPHLQLL